LKKPLYQKLVEFYQKILKTQEDAGRNLDINPVEIEKELKTPRLKEGFPLIEKADVIIDIPSSVKLFELCHRKDCERRCGIIFRQSKRGWLLMR
jgi:hypothetical protein